MGENKKTRIKLEGWLEHIAIHERKIAEELAKPEPNMGLVSISIIEMRDTDPERLVENCARYALPISLVLPIYPGAT